MREFYAQRKTLTSALPSSSSGDTPAPNEGPLVTRWDPISGCSPRAARGPPEGPTAVPCHPSPPGKISPSVRAVTRPNSGVYPDGAFRGA